MHDDHDHGAHAHHDHDAGPSLLIALVMTGSFCLVEIGVGFWSGSLALLADAGHMVSDTASLIVALICSRLALRPPSPTQTYGYRRVEVLAALGNGVLLAITAAFIIREAISRWITPAPVAGETVTIMGIAGLAVNLAAAWLLHRDSHNINVRAAFLHVLADALGSVAAIIAGVVVQLTGNLRADPALALVVAALLVSGSWRILRQTAHILMDGTPAGIDPSAVAKVINAVPGVASVHDIHVWSIGSSEPAASAHVVLQRGGPSGEAVVAAVGEAIHHHFGIHHTTIQPESPLADIVPLRVHGAASRAR